MAKYLNYEGVEELIEKLKSYADSKVGSLDIDLFVVVTALPETGEANKIYLVPSATTATYNKYDEYIWLTDGNTWEYFGEAHLDVDVEQLLENYIKTVSATGTSPLTLSATKSGNELTITGSIAAASSSENGYMSSSDKSKLDSMDTSKVVQSASATGTAPLTLGASISDGALSITGSIAEATTSAAGTMSAADKTKLDALDTSKTVQSASASGTAPLTLSASISNGALTISGSIAASSASADGYMSSTQYTQLANLVEDPLQYATAITVAEIDALF